MQRTKNKKQRTRRASGFTLIETLVAISLLTLSILAPMALATQSLSSAYYARDQITAFNLGQEAIESVRSLRDTNVLREILGTPTPMLLGIPVDTPFVIDTRDNRINACTGLCPPMKTDGTFYAYGPIGTTDPYGTFSGWSPTRFRRTVTVTNVVDPDEVKISVQVQWQSGSFKLRTFTISENLYQWAGPGS